MTKKLLIFALTFVLMFSIVPTETFAKTTTVYSTQKIKLRKKAAGKILKKVGKNTKLKLIKSGKKWSRVKYKGNEYLTLKKYLSTEKAVKKYTGAKFKRTGVIWWKNKKYTWYSQRVLPGYGLKIPGRHVDKQGFVCDKYGYIVLGSSRSNRGKIVATPFGKFGKVYDAGCVGTYWYDCYTNF